MGMIGNTTQSSSILDTWHSIRGPLLATAGISACLYLAIQQTRKNRDGDKKGKRNENNDEKLADPPQLKEKEGRIYAIDFTTTGTNSISTTSTIKSKPKSKRIPKRFTSKGAKEKYSQKRIDLIEQKLEETTIAANLNSKIIIFYSTLTGTCERYAKKLYNDLKIELINEPELLNIDYINDLDDYFVSPKDSKNIIYLFVIPSYETESPIDFFIETLIETFNDFRIDNKSLQNILGFSVFGVGDKEGWPEDEKNSKFCYQAKLIDKYMSKLGAPRLFPLGTTCVKTEGEINLNEWSQLFLETLKDPTPKFPIEIVDSDDENEGIYSEIESSDEDQQKTAIVDVEDMGNIIKNSRKSKSTDSGYGSEEIISNSAKQMVAKDSPTYKSLTKQGYTVVGSHSGVKICRWTKSALRGRGSCYKFAFYGIKSHLCMETTPSLSCSNKCVFCWRHGTNPVGTTWRWQVDPPQTIFNGALEGHYNKIKQMKGVPGVSAARFAEAFRVRHCALSLVGEPIFYPHINEFVGLLHAQRISSFLVCNAQHPDQLRAMNQVTQLYVSIDASTKDSLKKVDRPLYRDFWERLNTCLDIIKEKKTQRTVFRLTLVKGFNMDEVDGYVDLVRRGLPCFIEIKGATFCGSSGDNGDPLTMKNIPFYEEVKKFVVSLNEKLNNEGLEYDIAAEHAHSCCILMAQKRFKINGVWHTHIDYDRFFDLLEEGVEFGPMDYLGPTPDWAWWGSDEAGFNPQDTRFYRKKAAKAVN